MTLTGGDTIAARCTMVSYRDRMTWVGATAEDEMCNFYLMYWVDGQEKLNNERCVSVGPPVYSWDRMTWVGATAEDEMCNFYLMYWVQGQRKLSNERCTSLGPPVYAWDRWLVGGGLSNIP